MIFPLFTKLIPQIKKYFSELLKNIMSRFNVRDIYYGKEEGGLSF